MASSGSFIVGEAVEVWSESREVWDSALVDMVIVTAGVYDGFSCPAGTVKVCMNPGPGVKWVLPDQVARMLRKTGTSSSSIGLAASRPSGGQMSSSAGSTDPSSMAMYCEYMWGDTKIGTAAARLLPTSWTGSITFAAAIEKLQEELKTADHPIIMKSPPGVFSKETEFANINEALEYLKTDLREHAKKAVENGKAAVADATEAAAKATDEFEAAKKLFQEAETKHAEATAQMEAASKSLADAEAALAAI